MKWLALLLICLACERALPLEQNATHGVKPTLLSSSANGDSLRFGLSWDAGKHATAYRVWVRSSDSGWAGLPTDTTIASLGMQFTAFKAGWDSTIFTAVVKGVNQFGTSPDSAWARWRMGRLPGAPDSIVVDTSLIVLRLLIAPHSLTISQNDSALFCAFAVYNDGGVAEGTNDHPTCDSLYHAVASPGQVASPAQIAHFDSMCVTWTVTGGTMNAPGCGLGAPHFQQLAIRR